MTTAGALAVALPATGLIIAVVLAIGRLMWRGLNDRIDEQGRGLSDRIDEQGRGLSDRIDEQGRGLSDRIDEQGRGLTGRLDEHGIRLGAIEQQQGEILRVLGRIEGRLGLPAESAGVA